MPPHNQNDDDNDNHLHHLVFVYGTLKRGEPNHSWMIDQSHGKDKFVARGRMIDRYPLVIASKYNIPFLLNIKDQGLRVEGEVYRIDDEKLKHLDILEDYPKLYTRRLEEIEILEPKKSKQPEIIKAYTYFLIRHKETMLNLEFLANYSSSGPHGRPYLSEDDLSDPDAICEESDKEHIPIGD